VKRKAKPRPRGRPPRELQPLTRERILSAAIALVDRDGVEGLTIRVLAQALGVSAMALYNHVPNKEALLDGIHEALLLEVELPALAGRTTWRRALSSLATGLRAALRRHPHTLSLVATRPIRSERMLAAFDALLGVLRVAGFTGRESIYLVDAVAVFVVGHAFAEHGASFGARPDRDGTDMSVAALRAANLTQLADAIELLGAHDYDAEFAMALDALLDGFAQRIARAPAVD
jgi:TetR/AcrR family transcriptional regulator, tetracycline repressor protein